MNSNSFSCFFNSTIFILYIVNIYKYLVNIADPNLYALINKIFGKGPFNLNQRSDSMLTLSTRFRFIITKKLGLLDEDCKIKGFLCTGCSF